MASHCGRGVETSASGFRVVRGVAFLLFIALRCVPCHAGIGFCLDEVPALLQGTGFTAPSSYSSQSACEAAGHSWCPLSDETDTWLDGQEYYWYSACCNGKQGSLLLPDASGFPTCDSEMASEDCSRLHWHQKVLNDLVLTDDYVMDAAPVVARMPPMRAPGLQQEGVRPPCLCEADSEDCMRKSSDGTYCVNCKTIVPCSNDTIYLGLHVFKLHSIDLKSTHMSLSSWVRESWQDARMAYNIQCYGGLDYFEVKAQDGALEDSRIWVPDIELYNHEEPIWAGSLTGRLAMVYPCTSSGKPSYSRCGDVFWSRPGLLKALCKFDGLEMFPLDTLRCKLELAAFSIDGRYQDIVPRRIDGGVSYVGKEDSNGGFEGITAGTNFQDYRILGVKCDRYVTTYDCCQGLPFPTLIYEVKFGRASTFYIVRLLLPAVSLAAISFITFWMNPEIGERLGFGITVILAMVANDVVASDMMPIAGERLLMDHVSLGCQIFGWISLLETAIVLYLYHHLADNWLDALVPGFILTGREFLMERWAGATKQGLRRETIGIMLGIESHSSLSFCADAQLDVDEQVRRLAAELYESKDRMMRKHLYRQIFYMVDKDFSGTLSINEIEEFGAFMMGSSWSKDKARLFMRSLDVNRDGVLKLDEFAIFCEGHLQDTQDHKYITKMVEGFLQVLERKRDTKVRMWQMRAKSVDAFCRWTLPPGFVIFLIVVLSLSEEQMNSLMWDRTGQFWLFSISFWPLVLSIVLGLAALILTRGVHTVATSRAMSREPSLVFKAENHPFNTRSRSHFVEDDAAIADALELREVKIPGSIESSPLRCGADAKSDEASLRNALKKAGRNAETTGQVQAPEADALATQLETEEEVLSNMSESSDSSSSA